MWHMVLALSMMSCADSANDSSRGRDADPVVRAVLRGLDVLDNDIDSTRTQLRAVSGLVAGTPVVNGDFADAAAIRFGDDLYAFSTNTADANIPAWRVHLNRVGADDLGDALPVLPAWAEPGFVWAPAAAKLSDGYVLYYSTRVAGTSMQCVSRATSATPAGPFVDDSAAPMVCQEDLGGTIDPSVVADLDGQRWLLFKNDGNCCGFETSIWSARLSEDGLEVIEPFHRLLAAEPGWEGNLIEGPSMLVDDHAAYLFYSANAWDSVNYAIGVARCDSPAGPCARITDGEPWLSSTRFARGPGGQEFFDALGSTWMIYHGWYRGDDVKAGAQRRLFVDLVEVGSDGPVRVGRGRAVGWIVAVVALIAATIEVIWWRRKRRRPSGPR